MTIEAVDTCFGCGDPKYRVAVEYEVSGDCVTAKKMVGKRSYEPVRVALCITCERKARGLIKTGPSKFLDNPSNP